MRGTCGFRVGSTLPTGAPGLQPPERASTRRALSTPCDAGRRLSRGRECTWHPRPLDSGTLYCVHTSWTRSANHHSRCSTIEAERAQGKQLDRCCELEGATHDSGAT